MRLFCILRKCSWVVSGSFFECGLGCLGGFCCWLFSPFGQRRGFWRGRELEFGRGREGRGREWDTLVESGAGVRTSLCMRDSGTQVSGRERERGDEFLPTFLRGSAHQLLLRFAKATPAPLHVHVLDDLLGLVEVPFLFFWQNRLLLCVCHHISSPGE